MRRSLAALSAVALLSLAGCAKEEATLWLEVTGPEMASVKITQAVERASGETSEESYAMTLNPNVMVPVEGVRLTATVEATDPDSHFRVRIVQAEQEPDSTAAALAEGVVRGAASPVTVSAEAR